MKILVVVGTRPEAIKMAPVVRRLREEPDLFEVKLCATAQHRQMLDQVFNLFDLKPDIDLDIMRVNQSSNEVAARLFAALDPVLEEERPEWALLQGDTTTAMCAALASFHRGIRIGHVEAGLRTGDLKQPFPEEMNRRVTDLVCDAYFAPTRRAAAALAAEGIPATKIFLTGNTVVDALLAIAHRVGPVAEEDLVLVTAHRRESFGEPLRAVVSAVARLAREFPATRFVHVLHSNPNVLAAVEKNRGIANVELVEPLDYEAFVRLIRRARLILTDSGGIQEEAPTFGKPVLVLREKTERPEGIEAGVARLVGTDAERIFSEAARWLAAPRRTPARGIVNPYGDGQAADRIARILTGRPHPPFVAEAGLPAPIFA